MLTKRARDVDELAQTQKRFEGIQAVGVSRRPPALCGRRLLKMLKILMLSGHLQDLFQMARERPTVTLQALTVEAWLLCQVSTDKPLQ